MDPSRNNLPLQFNTNKNQPPMPLVRTISEGKEDDVSSSTNQNVMPMADNGDQNMMGGYPMMGQMGPMVGPMPADPNMMMMGPMNFNNYGGMMGHEQGPMMGGMGPMGGPMDGSMFGPMGGAMDGSMGGPGMMGAAPGMMGQFPLVKEVITLKSSVLYPPPVGAPPRMTRERPPGCRTIFVGGIPENTTEDLLFEVFESCGTIQSIRISKKNFAHIRFEMHESVDRALYISGYRMKIGDSEEKEDTGRIHVDFAAARDDQYEYECQQRAYAREMRHIQRMEEEARQPPEPNPIPHYTVHEGSLLIDKLKCKPQQEETEMPTASVDETFVKSSHALITWLEKGECNRRTSAQFYSMVQNVHSHVKRLNTDRQMVQAEYEQYKVQYQQRLVGIRNQLCQVERVMLAAHKQKCWDHFTKAQRKSIDTWQRQAQEAREIEILDDQQIKKEYNDDMDMSDDDGQSPIKKVKVEFPAQTANFGADLQQMLKEENEALKCQMEAFKNEVDMVRQEGVLEMEAKNKQMKALQNALQGMQQQLIAQRADAAAAASTAAANALAAASASASANTAPTTQTTATTLTTATTPTTASSPQLNTDQPEEKDKEEETKEDDGIIPSGSKEETVSSSGLNLSEKEAKMIGLVCCFLHVHPNGATVDYLWSYLRQLVPSVRTREVEDLLEKMPMLFKQEIIGVGAGIERRWIFSALSREHCIPVVL